MAGEGDGDGRRGAPVRVGETRGGRAGAKELVLGMVLLLGGLAMQKAGAKEARTPRQRGRRGQRRGRAWAWLGE